MNYIIIDLEATCEEIRSPEFQREVIEIGAVKISNNGDVTGEFNEFIKPIINNKLTEFCTSLTSITQTDVDGADMFSKVANRFQQWVGSEDFLLIHWGSWDAKQLQRDSDNHHLNMDWKSHGINMKPEYINVSGFKRARGMKGVLRRENIDLDGTHHRGIDDARNLSKIFLKYFDNWQFVER